MRSTLARCAFPFVCMLIVVLAVAGCGGSAGPPANVNAAAGSAHFEALAVPAGVAPELWDQLTAELARVLGETPPRGVSTPPAGDAGLTSLSYYEPTSTLNWLYQNSGDYNQDGLVGVSDLTPLGQHFGEESPSGAGEPFPAESLGAAIDGNGDGLIGISDITPIGQNFGVHVEGYRVYVAIDDTAHPPEPDGPNGAGTTWLASIELGEGDASAGRLRFYHQVVPTQAEQYYWVRPYHGEDDGAASNAVQVILPPPQAPVAVLSAVGDTETLAHIVWDAAASHDPDGGIVRWEWDFDGDGIFGHDSEGAATVDFFYYEAGTYRCTVRVTDGDGMTGEATETVHVTESETWHENVADAQQHPPTFGSNRAIRNEELLDVEGEPSLAYTVYFEEPDPETGEAQKVAYIHAHDAHGESWNERQLVPGSTGLLHALVVDGLPALVIERNEDHLGDPVPYRFEYWRIYTRAADASGTAWPIHEVIANWRLNNAEDWEGERFEVIQGFQLVDSRPAAIGLRYTEELDWHFAMTRALNSSGSSWPTALQSGDYFLSHPGKSIAAVDGKFAVLNFENGEDILYYRNQSASELSWAEPALVDHLEQTSDLFWLIDVNGFPAAVYYDDLLSGLKYRRALDAEGSAWAEPVVLSTAAQGHFNAAIIDGRPTVIFADRIDDSIKLIAANDGQGALWGFPSAVPTHPTGLDYSRVEYNPFAEVAGGPAYAYVRAFKVEEDVWESRLHYGAYY